MFFLKGKISKIEKDWVVIETCQIGFKVFLPKREIKSLKLFQPQKIYTYLYFNPSQNNFSLYGFLDEKELYLFEILVTLPQVGPKIALAVLDLAEVDTLISAVKNEKVEFFSKIPGVGKKTAQRIVLELASKISQIEKLASKEIKEKDFELIEVLESLGFEREKILLSLKKIDPNLEFEEKLKQALRLLSSNQ